MPWEYFAPAFLGNDAQPIDAATGIDIVKGNTQMVIDQNPQMAAWPSTINGAWTTTSATYTDASCFMRLPPLWIPSADSILVTRNVVIRCWVKSSSGAQTGVLRAWAGTRWAIPANVPDEDFVTVESSGITNTAYAEKSIPIELRRVFTWGTTDGEAADEPLIDYRQTYIGLQGKITGGATLTLGGFSIKTANP